MTTLLSRPHIENDTERCADCGGALFIHGDCVACTPLGRLPVSAAPFRRSAVIARPYANTAHATSVGMRYDWAEDAAG